MKILLNLGLHFARQDGQDGKKWKENHATKVTNIDICTKNQKTKIWDEQKIRNTVKTPLKMSVKTRVSKIKEDH